MIWRIFKKDWRQLRPLVVIVALAQLTNAALWVALGPFLEPRGLVVFAQVFAWASVLGTGLLIAAAVQLDVLPGVSQDWLIRPIRRRDLLGAKLLFVAAAVHAPMLLADLAHGAAAGFAVHDSLRAALFRSVSMLLVLDLPVLALAAMTRTLVQVAAALLGIWLTVVAGVLAGIVLRGGTAPVFAANGLQWMTPAFWTLLACAAASVTIPLQYWRRDTTRSRQIVVGAVLLAPALSFSTWGSAFSIQQWLSPNPAAAGSIAIAYDPDLGRSGAEPAATSANAVLLPLRVSGLASESIVMTDRAEMRVIGRDGTTLFSGRTKATLGYGDDFPVQTATGGDVRTHQRIVFPARVYERVRALPVRLEIDYSFTLFQMEATNAIAAINGNGRFAAFGWCRTQIDEDGDDVEVGCLKTGGLPTCVSLTLENREQGTRNPENRYCDPDYAPFRSHVYPDSMSQQGAGLRFRDLQGLARYPVDGSQLAHAQVILKSYRPEAHFTRRLVIPEIRLSEWASRPADDDTRLH